MIEPRNLELSPLLAVFASPELGTATRSILFRHNCSAAKLQSLHLTLETICKRYNPNADILSMEDGNKRYTFDINGTDDTKRYLVEVDLMPFDSEVSNLAAFCLRYKDPFVEKYNCDPRAFLAAANAFETARHILMASNADYSSVITFCQNQRIQGPQKEADAVEGILLSAYKQSPLR